MVEARPRLGTVSRRPHACLDLGLNDAPVDGPPHHDRGVFVVVETVGWEYDGTFNVERAAVFR